MKKFNDKIDEAWEKYWKTVIQLAETEFHTTVEPFLRSRRISFIAGMGLWYLTAKVGSRDVPINKGEAIRSKHWKPIIEILEAEVPGYDNGDFGSLMPNFSIDFGEIKRGVA